MVKKLLGLAAGLAMVGIALVILGPGLALALPNPPNLTGTTWEGKYEKAFNTNSESGTMSLTFTAQSGAIIRGTFVLSGEPGETTPFNGFIIDGELKMTAESGVINAQLIYDNTGTPVWKVRGHWHCTESAAPNPHTGYFLLKKQ